MITEYFSILLRKSKEKSFLQTNLKQPKLKNPFFDSYLHSNNLISFKTALLQTNLKQPKLKTPFYSYLHSNNLISFKMTFIGLIFV